jgi:hypothetical protein
MNRRILLVLSTVALGCLLCRGTALLHAADRKPLQQVNVNALTAETQKSIGERNSVSMVWIIPAEFWQVSLAQDKNLVEFQRRAVLNALEKYAFIGVVRAEVSPLGVFEFHDQDKVFRKLTAALVKGKAAPVPLKVFLKADDQDAQLVIDSMKPVLKNALGKMGEHFHLFVVKNRDDGGRPLISGYETSKVRVSLGAIGEDKGGTVEIAFPLDSLHVPRICADCGRPAHISWSYCPFCGKKHAR